IHHLLRPPGRPPPRYSCHRGRSVVRGAARACRDTPLRRCGKACGRRSEEHTSELQSLMRISYAVCCLKQKTETTRCNTDSTEFHDQKNTRLDHNIESTP